MYKRVNRQSTCSDSTKKGSSIRAYITSLSLNVWKFEIMSKLSEYWDYASNRPASLKKKTKKSKKCCFFLCSTPTAPSQAFEIDGTLYSFEDLWRLGIPDRYRKELYPSTIQNKLEVTPALYDLLIKSQVQDHG